ncbi:hypothetical protein K504DRAFT_460507 [Pleomassaria siparia CBS 279.74]|uniref:Uncharacterized protein n=1 Tax=Pleomassaria siparia CBS 279.74 TaxID=1314801 RepID=A0A6G1JYB0_9PLEO|nr:hypothetical protein K504DRAFT_460507 [Pleomassaria siparia CBS 279.74]
MPAILPRIKQKISLHTFRRRRRRRSSSSTTSGRSPPRSRWKQTVQKIKHYTADRNVDGARGISTLNLQDVGNLARKSSFAGMGGNILNIQDVGYLTGDDSVADKVTVTERSKGEGNEEATVPESKGKAIGKEREKELPPLPTPPIPHKSSRRPLVSRINTGGGSSNNKAPVVDIETNEGKVDSFDNSRSKGHLGYFHAEADARYRDLVSLKPSSYPSQDLTHPALRLSENDKSPDQQAVVKNKTEGTVSSRQGDVPYVNGKEPSHSNKRDRLLADIDEERSRVRAILKKLKEPTPNIEVPDSTPYPPVYATVPWPPPRTMSPDSLFPTHDFKSLSEKSQIVKSAEWDDALAHPKPTHAMEIAYSDPLALYDSHSPIPPPLSTHTHTTPNSQSLRTPYPSSSFDPELTWSRALQGILTSSALPSSTQAMIQDRFAYNGILDDGNRLVNARPADLGLVPNFSNPIASAPFYDRFAGERLMNGSVDGDMDGGANGGAECNGGVSPETATCVGVGERMLPNGGSSLWSIRSGHTSQTSTLELPATKHPITPTPQPDVDEFEWLENETTIAEQTQVINDQNSQIEHLNTDLAKLHAEITHLNRHWADALAGAIDTRRGDYALRLEDIEDLKYEKADLKIAMDFANKTLAACHARESELSTMIRVIKAKKEFKIAGKGWREIFKKKDRGKKKDEGRLPTEFEWENFGHRGPDPTGSLVAVASLPDGDSPSNQRVREQVRENGNRNGNGNGSGNGNGNGNNNGNGNRNHDTASRILPAGGRRSDNDATASRLSLHARNGNGNRSSEESKVSLSGSDISKLASKAEENIRVLELNIRELVGLINDCKYRPTGIQSPTRGRRRSPVPGSWRDV